MYVPDSNTVEFTAHTNNRGKNRLEVRTLTEEPSSVPLSYMQSAAGLSDAQWGTTLGNMGTDKVTRHHTAPVSVATCEAVVNLLLPNRGVVSRREE